LRRKRVVIPLASIVVIAVVLAALAWLELLVLRSAQGTFSMAPALPACNGQVIAEGFTYKFRDPHRSEIVVFHARGRLGGTITPDADSDDLGMDKRVIGLPGDEVVGRRGRVLVNGKAADDIPTESFSRVELRQDEYFVLGDNRSVSQDSRDFGPVPRDAIFARVVLVAWPLGRFGSPPYDKDQRSLGPRCGARS
jgi:signal peptidase I